MKVKVSEATNRQLDYLVALTQGYTDLRQHTNSWGDTCLGMTTPNGKGWYGVYALMYTIDHALTGPLIDKYKLSTSPEGAESWCAYVYDRLFEDDGTDGWSTGPTRLIAACRCIVTKHFGAEAEVPEDLT